MKAKLYFYLNELYVKQFICFCSLNIFFLSKDTHKILKNKFLIQAQSHTLPYFIVMTINIIDHIYYYFVRTLQ